MTLARIANEYGLHTHVFQSDIELLGFRNWHVRIVLAVLDHGRCLHRGDMFEPERSHITSIMFDWWGR